jgi:hypothetical protein
MKQQVNSNYEEIQEAFFDRIASEIVYGKVEYTKKDFFSNAFKREVNETNLFTYNRKQEYIDYDFFYHFFIVILHNLAIEYSEIYFENLVLKLKFYDDWQDLFKKEILKETELIIKKIRKKNKTPSFDFYKELNENIEFKVEEAQPPLLSLYDLYTHMNTNIKNSKNKYFIDFILDNIGNLNAPRLLKFKEIAYNSIAKRNLFVDSLRETYKEIYNDRYNQKESETYFTSLFPNKKLEEILFSMNLIFTNYGYSFEIYKISERINGFKLLSKIFAKFHYILFLKTSLIKGDLDLSKLEILRGFFQLKEFEEHEYKKIKQSTFNKRVSSPTSFTLTTSEENLVKIFKKINGKLIKKVDFNLFKKHFNNEEIKENEKLTWNKSKKLLAYFIGELRNNSYIPIEENLWQKTENCFLDIKSKNIKSTYQDINDMGAPKDYEVIDDLFK